MLFLYSPPFFMLYTEVIKFFSCRLTIDSRKIREWFTDCCGILELPFWTYSLQLTNQVTALSVQIDPFIFLFKTFFSSVSSSSRQNSISVKHVFIYKKKFQCSLVENRKMNQRGKNSITVPAIEKLLFFWVHLTESIMIIKNFITFLPISQQPSNRSSPNLFLHLMGPHFNCYFNPMKVHAIGDPNN